MRTRSYRHLSAEERETLSLGLTHGHSLHAFTAAGELRYAGGVLQGSTDADATAEFEIQLVGSPALVVGGAGTDIFL